MFKGGVKEAAKMLQGMSMAERKRLLADIQKKDAKLARLIQDQMVQFADLIHLNQRMMRDLLKEVDADTFGLALRAVDQKLRDHILSLVSSNNKKDILDILNGKPKMVTEVEEAQDKILEIVKKKVETGEFRLVPEQDEYV